MLSNYQLTSANFYNISMGKVKNFLPNFYDKEKYVVHYENFQLYLRLRLKLKKHCLLQFNQSQLLKAIC